MGIMDRIKEEANSAISSTFNTASGQQQQAQQAQQVQPQQMTQEQYRQYQMQLQQQQLQQQQAQRQAQMQQVQYQQQAQYQQQMRIPHYVVLQVTLKEKMIGTGSGNLSELENVINSQAAKGYRLHTISTAAGGSAGLIGGDRIQATLVFERL